MTSGWLYNNFGIDAFGLAFVLRHSEQLPLSKALLISPIITHDKLLSHLARTTTSILSFEKYLIENISNFSNFNQRYYDSLTNSFNAIQLLHELQIVDLVGNSVRLQEKIVYLSSMGKRAGRISKASHNISKILQTPSEVLYLNLRIEL